MTFSSLRAGKKTSPCFVIEGDRLDRTVYTTIGKKIYCGFYLNRFPIEITLFIIYLSGQTDFSILCPWTTLFRDSLYKSDISGNDWKTKWKFIRYSNALPKLLCIDCNTYLINIFHLQTVFSPEHVTNIKLIIYYYI